MPGFIGDTSGAVLTFEDANGRQIRLPRAAFEAIGYPIIPSSPVTSNPAIDTPPEAAPPAPPSPSDRLAQEQAAAMAREIGGDAAVPGGQVAALNPRAPQLGAAMMPGGDISPEPIPAPDPGAPMVNPMAPHLGAAAAPVQVDEQPMPVDPTGEMSPQEALIWANAQQEERDRKRLLQASTHATADVNRAADAQVRDAMADMAELNRMTNEYNAAYKKAADYKIDGNRKWHDMSTGKKVGAIIFAVISGIGSAMKKQGDKNPALDIINAAIDRDVMLQMDERDALGKAVGMKRQQIDDFMNVAQTRQSMHQLKKAAILERLANEVDGYAKQSSVERVQLEAAQLSQQFRDAAAAAGAAAAQQDFENTVKAAEAESKIRLQDAQTRKILGLIGGGGGAKIGKGGQFKGLTDQQVNDLPKADRERAVRLADGSWALTKSREAAHEADQILAGSRVMVQNLDRALSKIEQLPGFKEKVAGKLGWTADDTAVIQQELTQLQTNGKNYYQLGALSDADLELMKRLGGDPNGVNDFIQNHWGKLQNWRAGIVADSEAKVQQYGIDIDSEATYGAAPERARAKTLDEWAAPLRAEPAYVETENEVRGTDGSKGKVTLSGYETPSRDEVKESLRGAYETARDQGMSDSEWRKYLSEIDKDMKLQQAGLAGRADDLDKQAAKARKKGDKKQATLLAKRAAAARKASLDYKSLRSEVGTYLNKQIEKEAAKRASDAAKAKDARKTGERVERQGLTGGTRF